MKMCPGCHIMLEDHIKICPRCGVSDPVLHCPSCGGVLDLRYRQCIHCGYVFTFDPRMLEDTSKSTLYAVPTNNAMETSKQHGVFVSASPQIGSSKNKIGVNTIVAVIVLVVILFGFTQHHSVDQKRSTEQSHATGNRTTASLQSTVQVTPMAGPSSISGDFQAQSSRTYTLSLPSDDTVFHAAENILPKSNLILGIDHQILSLAQEHDSLGRYIVKVDYRTDDGKGWVNRTAYLYLRYQQENESFRWSPMTCFQDQLPENFREMINWNVDSSYTSDVEQFMIMRKEMREQQENTPQALQHGDSVIYNKISGESFHFTPYNVFQYEGQYLGYITVEWDDYLIDFGIGYIENVSDLLVTADVQSPQGNCMVDLNWSLLDIFPDTFQVDESALIPQVSAVYVDEDIADLTIFFSDKNNNLQFRVEYNAATAELIFYDARMDLTESVVIDWAAYYDLDSLV